MIIFEWMLGKIGVCLSDFIGGGTSYLCFYAQVVIASKITISERRAKEDHYKIRSTHWNVIL